MEKLKRSEVREGAFLILYQTMFGADVSEIDELNAEAFDMAKNEQTDALVKGVIEHDEELVGIISKYSKTRSAARIARVNLVILKIACYEMKYDDRTPCAAAINEAVELAKKYSMKQDSSFINGILNSFKRELEENGNKNAAGGRSINDNRHDVKAGEK